jgi:hypothetical protein
VIAGKSAKRFNFFSAIRFKYIIKMLNVSSLASRIQGLELNASRHSKLYTLNSKLLACKDTNFLSNNSTFLSFFYTYNKKMRHEEEKSFFSYLIYFY